MYPTGHPQGPPSAPVQTGSLERQGKGGKEVFIADYRIYNQIGWLVRREHQVKGKVEAKSLYNEYEWYGVSACVECVCLHHYGKLASEANLLPCMEQ